MDDDTLALEDKLSDLFADLVSISYNENFLLSLFACKVGEWKNVIDLCDRLPQVKEKVSLLEEECEGNLRVTWIDYSSEAYDTGYCMILFFVEELHWSSVAVYNKLHFMRSTS